MWCISMQMNASCVTTASCRTGEYAPHLGASADCNAFRHCASSSPSEPTQALGRLLTHADINERLKGRRAELWWPDDNLWYLIEIHEVDVTNHKAQVMLLLSQTMGSPVMLTLCLGGCTPSSGGT